MFFLCGYSMINVFRYLSKFLLSHESRSIAILDHFQSWKSLQHRLEDGRGNKSFFIHSLLLLYSARQGSRHITTHIIASFPSDVVYFAFSKIPVHFMLLRILNVMCGGYCHLMNVLSTSPSSLILIHFRGSMPLGPGQKNAFNIETV